MKPRFTLAPFDLDGTLCDTKADIVAATNRMREGFGLAPLTADEVQRLIGQGTRALVERALDPERRALAEEGERRLLAHYEEHCLDRTRPYPGLVDLVDRLSPLGVRFAVVTNKLHRLSAKILEGTGLAPRLTAIVGGDTFTKKKPDPRGVEHVIASVGCRRDEALMIGDSPIDVATARAAGIAVCGVLWGFDVENLRLSSPDFLVRDAAELERVIVSARRG
jgi:phosphoglycolate phosphatase